MSVLVRHMEEPGEEPAKLGRALFDSDDDKEVMVTKGQQSKVKIADTIQEQMVLPIKGQLSMACLESNCSKW